MSGQRTRSCSLRSSGSAISCRRPASISGKPGCPGPSTGLVRGIASTLRPGQLRPDRSGSAGAARHPPGSMAPGRRAPREPRCVGPDSGDVQKLEAERSHNMRSTNALRAVFINLELDRPGEALRIIKLLALPESFYLGDVEITYRACGSSSSSPFPRALIPRPWRAPIRSGTSSPSPSGPRPGSSGSGRRNGGRRGCRSRLGPGWRR